MIPPPKMLRAILFDLDGTCINSDDIHYEAYRDTLLELAPSFNNGAPISRDLYDEEMAGKQNPQLVAHILPDLSAAAQKAVWGHKEQRYEAVIAKGVEPIRGLVPLLRLCGERRVAQFIVTNAPRGSQAKTMAAIGITAFFTDAEWTVAEEKRGEGEGEETKRSKRVVLAEDCEFPKPHPAPYRRALELAGVRADEALVFEDSPAGVTAAVAAGIFTVGVRSTQTDEALRLAGASLTIEDYTDAVLLHLLEGWWTSGRGGVREE